MTKMLPCPFCGSENTYAYKEWDEYNEMHHNDQYAYAVCSECGAQGPTCWAGKKDPIDLVKHVKQNWNKYADRTSHLIDPADIAHEIEGIRMENDRLRQTEDFSAAVVRAEAAAIRQAQIDYALKEARKAISKETRASGTPPALVESPTWRGEPADFSEKASKKSWKDIDPSILRWLPNPSKEAYEMVQSIPECTFMGAENQPDFARIHMVFYPKDKIIELKSLKFYVFSLRDIHVSYERLANVMFGNIMDVYDPVRYRQVMEFNPRGGISSRIVIDSDWAARGGKEEFSDWKNNIGD